MKRSESLASLSRDHHRALVVAQRLRRGTADTAADDRTAFLAFWEDDGSRHFRVEEDVLLPAMARHVPARHDAIVRVLTDHVEIRRLAAQLGAQASPAPELLRELGDRLHDHVRHEERVLFPLVEESVPEAELVDLAAAVERAERGG